MTETKLCPECCEYKPLTNFDAKHRGKICRKCSRIKNKLEGKCFCGKPAILGLTKCEGCSNSHKKSDRLRKDRDKLAAFKHYGTKCVYCGENRLIFLTLDHINNDGAAQRREIGITCGRNYYVWLRQNNYPPIIQIACFNCNCAKNIIGEDELLKVLRETIN